MDTILQHDIEDFVRSFKLSDRLSHTRFLITGATGLIGSVLIHTLIALKQNIHIVAPLRNIKKGYALFSEMELSYIQFVECDLVKYDYNHIQDIDYLIHCAAPTSSIFFVEHPVETFNIIYQSTYRLLEYAKSTKVKGFVYLSSLEVYGVITDDSIFVTENMQGYLAPLAIRSSYPMAKRATENLCSLYATEYGVNVKIARLTQTTGAGISDDDNRVIVQFCRLASQNKDIILHTSGNAARPYCYTMDCISAVLYILLNGQSGEAYNVANQNSYISAKDLAIYIKDNFNKNIHVRVELNEGMGYAPETRLKLSTEKLRSIGWTPQYSLYQIIDNLIKSLR